MSGIAMVTLKDGQKVPKSALITITRSLEEAEKENPVALFDLVEKCKDAGYKFVVNPFGDLKATLRKWVLIDDDENMHDFVRTILLNSVEGSGMELRLVSPIQAKK